MTTSIESSAQFERDLRSANKEWKRTKDSCAKWSHGHRPSAGVRLDLYSRQPINGSETQQAKSRPQKRWCDQGPSKHVQNKVKPRVPRSWAGDVGVMGRMTTRLYAEGEIQDATNSRSFSDLLPPLTRRLSAATSPASENVLYSFDRADTPGRPVTLDIFVKAPTGRETEKLVEKEYEVLDGNGVALHGRKARRHLRQQDAAGGRSSSRDGQGGGGEIVIEDEGFELV